MTVWPTAVARPLASNLDVVAGQTVANMVVVPVGANGRVSIYNNGGSAHVVVDVLGWFPTDDVHGARSRSADGHPPPSTATATATAASAATQCHPSYPTVCIPPPPPDLDCSQIPYRRFLVRSPDPHRFDADFDGIGCESG